MKAIMRATAAGRRHPGGNTRVRECGILRGRRRPSERRGAQTLEAASPVKHRRLWRTSCRWSTRRLLTRPDRVMSGDSHLASLIVAADHGV